MNRSDSEMMAGLLVKGGYEVARDIYSADVILLNTCSVRQHAEEKVWSELGRLGNLKRERNSLILGVCGCMAQREGEGILRRAPFVDIVCGTDNFGRIAELLDRVRKKGGTLVDVSRNGEVIPVRSNSSQANAVHPGGQTSVGIKAWVAIMRGCNNFCAYCVVPHLRGKERSRAWEEILEEIKGLVKAGVKEITLLGQNVNSYQYRAQSTEHRLLNINFVDLLKMVNGIEGLERVRFVTSHPRDMTEEILKVVSRSEKVCEHLHLPLQAGSNRILKLMNRDYSREFYRDVVGRARELIPGVAITTDLIVGFPGERDEDFEETFDLVGEVGFDGAFIYKYSPRPGTIAAKMDGEVPEEVKRVRLQRLQELQKNLGLKKNQALIGREVEVLVEGLSKKVATKLSGRARSNKIVVFEGNKEVIRKLVRVKIREVNSWTLFGEIPISC
ncbi:tRNA (N6-isopentenyl adenosine(37)-C2)-methylthiotransferase MiaB [candidate division NPL-UPA2 bacterium]|nr:tRNA (N6-isopentenyl adenosine(37)-C2)-methylthiotransferase MiaB [candidate division NPL-UPA2 bacterium]